MSMMRPEAGERGNGLVAEAGTEEHRSASGLGKAAKQVLLDALRVREREDRRQRCPQRPRGPGACWGWGSRGSGEKGSRARDRVAMATSKEP